MQGNPKLSLVAISFQLSAFSYWLAADCFFILFSISDLGFRILSGDCHASLAMAVGAASYISASQPEGDVG